MTRRVLIAVEIGLFIEEHVEHDSQLERSGELGGDLGGEVES